MGDASDVVDFALANTTEEEEWSECGYGERGDSQPHTHRHREVVQLGDQTFNVNARYHITGLLGNGAYGVVVCVHHHHHHHHHYYYYCPLCVFPPWRSSPLLVAHVHFLCADHLPVTLLCVRVHCQCLSDLCTNVCANMCTGVRVSSLRFLFVF